MSERPAIGATVQWPETNHGVTSWRAGKVHSYMLRFGADVAVVETTPGGPLMDIPTSTLTVTREPAR